MATYVFKATLQEEDDGRWSAWVDALPGCAVWGCSREQALEALQDGADIYVEDMLECGEDIPVEEIGDLNTLTVEVTVAAISV